MPMTLDQNFGIPFCDIGEIDCQSKRKVILQKWNKKTINKRKENY